MSAAQDVTRRVERQGTAHTIGTYSDFYKGRLRIWGWTHRTVGLKVLRGGSNRPEFLQKFKEDIETKGAVWAQLNHPHVGKFYGFSFNLGNMPALVLEFYPHGNLHQYLRRNPTSEKSKTVFVYQIALAIQYLHNFKPTVVHGDIRTVNVMVDNTRKAVLVDYELAFLIDSTQFTTANAAGPSRWTAPELMLLSDDDRTATFTKETDIFAFSMTIVEIFTEERPFFKIQTDTAVIFAIAKGNRPEHPEYSEELADLVAACWAQDPHRRPSIDEICQTLQKLVRSPMSFMERMQDILYRLFTRLL